MLPKKNLVSPYQASMKAVRWLERLERGEISRVAREDLNVELSPVEIHHRRITCGDFSNMNQHFNTEKSETTHQRLLNNPTEWMEYHRQFRDTRKTWNVIPCEEIIKRIKSSFSSRWSIGDFGCGESQISRAWKR